jgi:thiamine biosynthesis lipoprotein
MNEDTRWPAHSFVAMGSRISVKIDAEERAAQVGFQIAQEFFARIEALLTRFKPTSELSHLNAHAGQWIALSPIFWGVLEAALALARETGGLFDPTVLPALEAAGYNRDFDAIQHNGVEEPLPQPSERRGRWAEVQLDPARRAVMLPAGVKVDLGGIAKGWAAQQAALLAGQWGPVLVDAGGDLAAGDPPDGMPGWPVSVAAPWDGPDGEPPDLIIMWLTHASLTTSGIDWRRWQLGGKTAHHLIDPRSGEPAATDLLSASVLAVEAAPAEAWATAAVVMGMGPAQRLFAGQGMAAVLVGQDRRVAVTPAMQPYVVESTVEHASF